MTTASNREVAPKAAGAVLLTLCAAQFLMALDSSVMNVSIATVAEDLGTTITGIQTAIVLYTLVMAMLMVTGGKVGSIIGRKRAFMIGCVIYCSGSLTTALSPNLGWLIFGWSFLEGVGAALIMPAIVALVAGNFPLPNGHVAMDWWVQPGPSPWRWARSSAVSPPPTRPGGWCSPVRCSSGPASWCWLDG